MWCAEFRVRSKQHKGCGNVDKCVRYEIAGQVSSEIHANDILEMLKECDQEFFPPLSARTSTVQSKLTGLEAQADGIRAYHQQLMEQLTILAYDEEGSLAGFLSYKENYSCPEIPEDSSPNVYITTVIVSPSIRGQGVASRLYEALTRQHPDKPFFVRRGRQI